MPTYVYRCGSCKKEQEFLQKMSDSPLTRCPECGQEALQRILPTNVGLHFKGSGFYKNDYASNKDGDGISSSPPGKGCGTGGCGCKKKLEP